MSKKIIKLSSDEIFPLLNILNEVCHGLYVRDFEHTIGAQRRTVVNLMDTISEKEMEKEIILEFNIFELNFLKNSFEEVFRQIEEWEFQIRIGITIQEANMTKEKILR